MRYRMGMLMLVLGVVMLCGDVVLGIHFSIHGLPQNDVQTGWLALTAAGLALFGLLLLQEGIYYLVEESSQGSKDAGENKSKKTSE